MTHTFCCCIWNLQRNDTFAIQMIPVHVPKRHLCYTNDTGTCPETTPLLYKRYRYMSRNDTFAKQMLAAHVSRASHLFPDSPKPRIYLILGTMNTLFHAITENSSNTTHSWSIHTSKEKWKEPLALEFHTEIPWRFLLINAKQRHQTEYDGSVWLREHIILSSTWVIR